MPTNPPWRQVRLREILTYVEELVPFDDFSEYITITVKRRHGGLETRERLLGHEIKTKKQFRLIRGAFIISRIQCWHQAYAVVPEDVPENMIASQNYDQFTVSSAVDNRFFWWFSHSPLFTETVRSSAFGVVIEKMVFNREAWLDKEIPLPSLDEQRRIVSRIEELSARIREGQKLRTESTEGSSSVITSMHVSLGGERLRSLRDILKLDEAFNEPLRNRFPCPISARSGRRRYFSWFVRMIRHVNTQALEAGVAGFRPRIVDPDIPIESSLHFLTRFLVAIRGTCRVYLNDNVR